MTLSRTDLHTLLNNADEELMRVVNKLSFNIKKLNFIIFAGRGTIEIVLNCR